MGYESKVTTKGQTTIPAEIREHLKVRPGDRIRYVREEGGSVRMFAKNRRLADLAGILGTPPRGAGATIEDMDRAVGDFLAADNERIRRQWREGRE